MTSFKIGNTYNGFELISEREIKEINSLGRLFYHKKSGARLFHLENDDDNKVFSISFRTPPEDDTGLPHILEHAVLGGSRKFPLKDPFIELAKGSLNTYLNAMTFSDKTMYPVASQNHKDFMNLMDVYLDAVLYPNIYGSPETLMQEGWHYEINEPEEAISIKGVVYNEMKGAFSSPEQVLFRKIEESLFPDTIYRFESGGDPEAIPNLTYEQFIKFHSKYYHPSNSYIYLYGDGDLLKQLEFIDQEYLSQFNKIEVDSAIAIQPAFEGPREVEEFYSISEDEGLEDKTYISQNYVIGRSEDVENVLAFSILNYILLGTPAAPLKKALIESNIGKDVFGSFNSNILQPSFSIVVKNSNEEKKEEFTDLVKDSLNKLVREGIDRDIVQAAINIHEFKLREADYGSTPKGLVYNINCMTSWLYDREPWLSLEYEAGLKNIKEGLEDRYFEKLIEKYILNNSHSSVLILKPQRGLANEKQREEEERLRKLKEELSQEEIQELIRANKKLNEYQARTETQEALESIPLLNREDIKREVDAIELRETLEKGVKILHHPNFTNEIAYINLFFDTRTVPQDLIPYISLLTSLLGKISTENYNYDRLSNLIDINTGGISSTIEAYSLYHREEEYLPKLTVKASALIENLPKLFDLLGEVVNNTQFDNPGRIKEVIDESRSRLEMVIFDRGHMMAAARVNSYFSPVARFAEETKGISYYMFISQLAEEFDKRQEEILAKLKEVYKSVFNKNNILISVTSEAKDFEGIRSQISSFIAGLAEDKLETYEYKFDFQAKNEGLLTPSKVQYVAKGYNIKKLGYDYAGHMQVLRTIISLDYLWNKVRIRGGAYGSMARFSKNGNLLFSSYRDPNLARTLDVYNDMYKYIENFQATEREMLKYIIGTISNMDTPLTPAMKGDRGAGQYISGIRVEDLQKERDQVLSTGLKDIRKYSSLLKEAMDKNYLCVLGNEEEIEKNKQYFNKLVKVFQ